MMASIPLFTYKDVIDHLVDYLGDNATQTALRDARRAAQDGYRDLMNAHDWSYLVVRGRVNTSAPQTAGTIQHQESSGPYPRYVTLTGATWPAWAAYGQVVISNIIYQVAQVFDSTHLQLSIGSDPGQDFAAGTAYTLSRHVYPLPCDFVAAERVIDMLRGVRLTPEHPRQWLARQQVYQGPSAPYTYCFLQDPHSFGAMAIGFFPTPDQVYPMDFLYKRRMRRIVFDQYSTGTASTAGGAATITGSGTTWTSAMVGSVVRLSGDTVNVPTGLSGNNRAAEENVIIAVPNATTLTIDAPIATAYTGVKYVISDPIDLEDGAMLTAYLRCCENQNSINRIMKNQAQAMAAWKDALIQAKESDRRNLAQRVPGAPPHFLRLRDFPMGGDVS